MKNKLNLLSLLFLALLTNSLSATPQDDYTLGDDATNLQAGEYLRERYVPATISIFRFSTNGQVTTNIRACAWEGVDKVMRRAVTVYSPQRKARRVIVTYYDRSGAVFCSQVTFIDEKGRGTTVTQRFFGNPPSGVRKTVSTYGLSGFVIQSKFFYTNGELKVLTMTGKAMEAEVVRSEILRYSPSTR